MEAGKTTNQRNKRLEKSALIQIWVPREEVEILKLAAKSKSIPMSTFIRLVAVEAATSQSAELKAS